MREFQEKRRFKKLLYSRYVIAVLFIFCILLVRAVWGVYDKYEKSREISDKTKTDFSAMFARREFLTREIADLNTDLGRESEIRERFGAVRGGERLVVLIDDKSGKKPMTQITSESWFSRLVGFFGF